MLGIIEGRASLVPSPRKSSFEGVCGLGTRLGVSLIERCTSTQAIDTSVVLEDSFDFRFDNYNISNGMDDAVI